MRTSTITPQYVDTIPDHLEEGILYISERYGTAIHKCPCGCGEEVVTPLTPADWHLHRSGSFVSLSPSIGNWSYACRSHYWIHKNKVVWAAQMSERQIALVKAGDKAAIEAHVKTVNQQKISVTNRASWARSIWKAVLRWALGK